MKRAADTDAAPVAKRVEVEPAAPPGVAEPVAVVEPVPPPTMAETLAKAIAGIASRATIAEIMLEQSVPIIVRAGLLSLQHGQISPAVAAAIESVAATHRADTGVLRALVEMNACGTGYDTGAKAELRGAVHASMIRGALANKGDAALFSTVLKSVSGMKGDWKMEDPAVLSDLVRRGPKACVRRSRTPAVSFSLYKKPAAGAGFGAEPRRGAGDASTMASGPAPAAGPLRGAFLVEMPRLRRVAASPPRGH